MHAKISLSIVERIALSARNIPREKTRKKKKEK
jgi:hypothetical protein